MGARGKKGKGEKEKPPAAAAPPASNLMMWGLASVVAVAVAGVLMPYDVGTGSTDGSAGSGHGGGGAVNAFGDREFAVDDRKIIVVKDFLPPELAERWRDEMRDALEVSRPTNGPPPASGPWLYTSNTNGTSAGGNAKTRGNFEIAARQQQAQRLAAKGLFAYSKWELAPTHRIVTEISEYMKGSDARTKIAAHFGVPTQRLLPELSDLFVTWYGAGDFLSPHDDSYAGTYAFVVSLTDGPTWTETYGGHLQYYCQRSREWCQELGPQFNTVALFKTMEPRGPIHQVKLVDPAADAAGWKRFGYTGWYVDRDVGMSTVAIQERDKMRGTTVKD